MIDFNFSLRNPFSDRWSPMYNFDKRIGKHKALEVEILKDSTIVSFGFRFTAMQDHAGVNLSIGLLGYFAMFNFYDTRHWDEKNNTWKSYDK